MTASVESMMVPSISNRKPSKATSCGGRLYSGTRPMAGCEFEDVLVSENKDEFLSSLTMREQGRSILDLK